MSESPPGHSPAARTVLPVLAALVLIGLIFLLPRRDVQTAVGTAPLDLPPLELDEPPAWALQRGDDEQQRSLDRLAWGGHGALDASRRTLEHSAGKLAPEILRRLRATGENDPVLAEKLVSLLAGEDLSDPAVVDELVRRALGTHPLPAKSALRALARVRGRRALDGILPRVDDADEEVRSFARGALAQRARTGDSEAQAVVLAELEGRPGDPDLAYLTVVESFPDAGAHAALLHEIARQAPMDARLIALSTLLGEGDAEAKAFFDQLVRSPDALARTNGWRALGAARIVGGEDLWRERIGTAARSELLSLSQVLTVAIDTDHPAKGEAEDLLLALAADRTNSVHDDILTALYVRGDPWAIEATRQELATLVGPSLGVTVDRVIGGKECPPDLPDLVLHRLQDPELRDEERVLLCRLLAHVAPAAGAEAVVTALHEVSARAPALAPDLLVLLPLLGPPGLALLERDLQTPAGRALFIRTASDGGDPAALPGLERILLDKATAPGERVAALDALARIRTGPRAEVLRRVTAALDEQGLTQRARLLFWNYM